MESHLCVSPVLPIHGDTLGDAARIANLYVANGPDMGMAA